MKILIVIADISLAAGSERAVSNLANLITVDHDVSIVSISSSPGQKSAFTLDPRVNVIHLGLTLTGNISHKTAVRFTLIRRLSSVIRESGCDLIIGARRVVCLLFPLLPKCKKVACEHFEYNTAPLFSRMIRRICYPLLDAVVLLTARDAEKYTFIPEHKRFVIPNSLSFSCAVPSNCENKRIIALGRFTPQKGFDYLLQAAVKIKQAIPDWHIDVFGSGDDETMLKDLAKKLQVDDFVSFLPPTKEVEKELCNSGMYIMSSRYEGLPMVLIEAQECGLPIVSFDCPEGPSEIIHDGEDGFLVPLADTDALAEKVILLAKNQEMRENFGRNAKKNAARFSPEKITLMWQELLTGICPPLPPGNKN